MKQPTLRVLALALLVLAGEATAATGCLFDTDERAFRRYQAPFDERHAGATLHGSRDPAAQTVAESGEVVVRGLRYRFDRLIRFEIPVLNQRFRLYGEHGGVPFFGERRELFSDHVVAPASQDRCVFAQYTYTPELHRTAHADVFVDPSSFERDGDRVVGIGFTRGGGAQPAGYVQKRVEADCTDARVRVRDSRGYGPRRALLWEQIEATPAWREARQAGHTDGALHAALCAAAESWHDGTRVPGTLDTLLDRTTTGEPP